MGEIDIKICLRKIFRIKKIPKHKKSGNIGIIGNLFLMRVYKKQVTNF